MVFLKIKQTGIFIGFRKKSSVEVALKGIWGCVPYTIIGFCSAYYGLRYRFVPTLHVGINPSYTAALHQ
jgi:hypothetical protein